MPAEYQRDYLLRLPLPLAQLYRRARNSPDPRGRHNNTFFLFEASIKLVASVLIAVYGDDLAHGGARTDVLDERLKKLSRPMLGEWLGMLRELATHFAARPDAASHPLGDLATQLRQPRRDLKGILALYQRIKNGVDGQCAGDESCSLMQLFGALVPYRNVVFGHGAEREVAFYDQEMSPLLFPAANDLLGEAVFERLLPPASRLVYLTEIRRTDQEIFSVSLKELVGTQSERADPLSLNSAQAEHLLPNRVALIWPGRAPPLVLDPLLVFRETDSGEELRFLNCDHNGKQVEYLSYTSGTTERDPTTAQALAALLRQVTGHDAPVQTFKPPVEAAGPPDDFEIVAELGRGGMGVVYLARQRSLGRWVALKMLPTELAGDEVALARLRREIRVLAQCDDPHIVKVLTSGTTWDGQLYYAMEYVPGADMETVWRELAGPNRKGPAADLGGSTWSRAVLTASGKQREKTARSASRREDNRLETGSEPPSAERPLRQDAEEPLESGSAKPSEESERSNPRSAIRDPQSNRVLPLPPLPELPIVKDDPGGYERRVATLIRDAARALQIVHDRNIVHRDVKPANLLLTPDGSRVVLMDFGLAKGQTQSLTAGRAGGLLGTLRYAAPEQLAAANVKVGAAADIRGLGVTLWELLTRERLFGDAADEGQLASWVLHRDVPRLRTLDASLNRDLEAIVAKATERNADDRIQTARELADHLELYLLGKDLPIRIPGPAEMLRRWARGHGPLLRSAAAVLILVSAGFAYFFHRAEERRAETRADGLVDKLLVAPLDQVPAIAADLGPYRRWADPLLRAELDQPPMPAGGTPTPEAQAGGTPTPQAAGNAARRLRAALGLLPVDAGQVERLRQAILTATPGDARVLIAALAGHRSELVTPLWRELRGGADSAARLRAAMALAAYDPPTSDATPEGWQAGATFVADRLLAEARQDPSQYEPLVAGLQGAAPALVGPLAVVFRDAERNATERELATNVLARYAAGDVAALADFVSDANPAQFAALFPALALHGGEAVSRLSAELVRRVAPDWRDPPLDLQWQSPAQATTARLEAGAGMLAERFAFCQTLALEEFASLADELGRAGYRPVRLRPYVAGDRAQVAAVWRRDGREWKLGLYLTADQVCDRDRELQADGYVPEDAAGYMARSSAAGEGSGAEPAARFAALWARRADDADERRLYVDLAGGEPPDVERLKADGFAAATLQAVVAPPGAPRYATIWQKSTAGRQSTWDSIWNTDERAYAAAAATDRLQVDVSLATSRLDPAARIDPLERLARAQAAVQANAEDLNTRFERGRALFAAGDDQGAIDDLSFLAEKVATFAGTYLWRAQAYARLGRAGEARADLARYVELSGSASLNAYVDAIVSARLGDYDAALARLETAVREHSGQVSFLYDAACACAVLAALAADGQPQRREPLRARAMELLVGAVEHGYSDFAQMRSDADLDSLHELPAFEALLARGPLERRYAAVFESGPPFSSAESHGLAPAAHLARSRELIASGYRPAAISAVDVSAAGAGDLNLVTASVWHLTWIEEAEKERLAVRQANAAAALARLGQAERVWPLLVHTPDPRVRSWLVHRLAPLGVDPRLLIERLFAAGATVDKADGNPTAHADKQGADAGVPAQRVGSPDQQGADAPRSPVEAVLFDLDTSLRRALLLALGEFDEEQLRLAERERLVPKLLELYRADPDAGVHGAVAWLLRRWGRRAELAELDKAWAAGGKSPPDSARRWYVNSQRQTMVVVPGPIEFLMGSPLGEPDREDYETRHRRRVGRSFAISAHEVTVEQVKAWKADFLYGEGYARYDDCPMNGASWYEAAEYCNWLSDQEQLDRCYERNEHRKFAEGMKPAADYLERRGYRLPTEAEWEAACRAGAVTSRYYGGSETLLGEYAWYTENLRIRWLLEVGTVKPNDLGLFDMLGNTGEWCEDPFRLYPLRLDPASNDSLEALTVADKQYRVLRGGSFFDTASDVRSACRTARVPTIRYDVFGFRVARTYP